VKLLLDTHALLWWLLRDARLSKRALDTLAQPGNTITVSAASGWEIATKFRLGKLAVPRPLAEDLEAVAARNGWTMLAVTMRHAQRAGLLQGTHKDPFDRILAAQALTEDMPLVTDDPAFAGFAVRTLW
jgi:PIN domain nuclease of toxin-antitoxin system